MSVQYPPGHERLVHAEFRAFIDAQPDAAADSFAVLHHLAVAGWGALDAAWRDGFGLARPYCHQAAGWGVFFDVSGPRDGRCNVTVLKVAHFADQPFELAKREAVTRRQPPEPQENLA